MTLTHRTTEKRFAPGDAVWWLNGFQGYSSGRVPAVVVGIAEGRKRAPIRIEFFPADSRTGVPREDRKRKTYVSTKYLFSREQYPWI